MAQQDLKFVVSAVDKNASRIFGKLKRTVLSLAGAYLSIQGIRKFVDFMGKSVQAASTQEKALAKLTQQMKNHNELTLENVKALEDQASALQMTTQFADEQILSAQAMLASFNLTTEAIMRVTPRMLDLAVMSEKATGAQADLNTVAKMVGVALGGQAGRLLQMGIALTDNQRLLFQNAQEQERLNILLEIFDSNAQGLAESIGKTFFGAQQKMNNIIGDAQEEIGKLVTENKALIAVMGFVTNKVAELNVYFKDNEDKIRIWAQNAVYNIVNFGRFAIETFLDVQTAFASLGTAIFTVAKHMMKINEVMSFGIAKSTENKEVIEELLGAMDTWGMTSQNVKTEVGKLHDEMIAFMDEFVSAPEKVLDVGNAFNDLTETVKKTGEAIKGTALSAEQLVELWGEGSAPFQTVEQFQELFEKMNEELGERPLLVDMVREAEERLTEQAVAHYSAMKDLASGMLEVGASTQAIIVATGMSAKAVEFLRKELELTTDEGSKLAEQLTQKFADLGASFVRNFIDTVTSGRFEFDKLLKEFVKGIMVMITKTLLLQGLKKAFGFGFLPFGGGGVVPAIRKFQHGGEVPGGAPFVDRIPALLSPRERVLTEGQNKSYERVMRGEGAYAFNFNVTGGTFDEGLAQTIVEVIRRELPDMLRDVQRRRQLNGG